MVRPARGAPRRSRRVEYYDARARAWKRVRTVSVSGANRFVYLRTQARGKYFRLVRRVTAQPQGRAQVR